ncbi:DHH family phosphoesterase [Candidatus Woesearchaeota archaeon]|jgi:single-stranded DNA-specific DHH superfamily exonuclease|nr:DHH family phosphoesterase [Candidatus Woesearchaeota archaeon]MBT5215900.1 DHH family phosphoesterase [Candidatus Woesearchaeota archaeon]MBT6402227.1 DHH family phosphoesterase [Candidatus Woesearchaeota archaeon]
MLTDAQIQEIRGFLEKAENPLFLFDDDPDGLTSYLLLKKHYKKGHGTCIKSSPKANVVYSAAYKKHKPDLVVILDKPVVSQEILDGFNVPVVWIDHHQVIERDGVNYYNSMAGDSPDNRPTSHWAYKVVEDNEWVALVGIIGDWNVPEKSIVDKFKYPELLGNVKTPPELMFDTEYGKMIKVFSFILKGNNDSMNKCIEALEEIEDPMEILNQTTSNGKLVYEKYEKMNKEYETLLEDSLSQDEEEVYVYTYVEQKNSFTGNLSNEMLHKLKSEVIIIGREASGDVRLSLRSKGKPILPILKKALEEVEGYGGGHAMACGASVKMHDFPKFVEIIKREYKKE